MKKKLFTIIISAVLAVSMLFALAACGSSTSTTAAAAASTESDLAYIQEKGVLVVGVTDFAPMDYQENGEWVGFDADLARLFAEELGVEVEFLEIDWDNKILEIDAKTVDCIWNGMTLTDEVAAAMSCTNSYALNAQVVVCAKDKLYANAADDVKAKYTYAVEAGSAGESVAIEKGFTVNSVQNQAAALMEVAAGTSDCCVIDKTMADAMTGDGTSYENLGTVDVLSSEEYVVGFRTGSDLTAKLNELFKTWTSDGTMKALSEQYNNAVSLVESK